MQDYIGFAEKNGVTLLKTGPCQFCGANTKRGIQECLEVFNLGFQDHIDFSHPENHVYRFLIVDAHTLQHSEIHGRWNNHFHLSRLHLILRHNVSWSYTLSPKLSNYLNQYKLSNPHEQLIPPPLLYRGQITSLDILDRSVDAKSCKALIHDWALGVYHKWENAHSVVDAIALGFLNQNSIHSSK